jgi:hypothetical protein
MGCALHVAVVSLVLCAPLQAGSDRDDGPMMLHLTFTARQSVRRGVTLALARLSRPGCSNIFADFRFPDGRTPRSELDRLGIEPAALVKSLVFVDGSGDPVCGNGRAVLTTTPGSKLIRVCPGFAQVRDPGLTACLVLHESLHALGLGEDPPTSRDITTRVERRCW